MAKVVDTRGLACPQPVILTREALQETDVVTTIVDNEAAQHNVTRMAEKSGCSVKIERREEGIYLHIAKKENVSEGEMVSRRHGVPTGRPLVLVMPNEVMGRGDDELGHILIRTFFHSLGEAEPLPDTIIFFNTGVRLTVEGSPVLEDLRELCRKGVEMLSCGTCLGHFNLKEKLAVGEVSNMYTIAQTLLNAARVVSL